MDLAKHIASMAMAPSSADAPTEATDGEATPLADEEYQALAEGLISALKDGNASEVADLLKAYLGR